MTKSPITGTANAEVEQEEIQKPLKKQAIRNQEYYQMIEITDQLYQESKDDKVFTNLMEIITSENNIRLAYRNLRTNKGSNTPGTDGKSIADISSMTDSEAIWIVRNKLKDYKPDAVRRVEIPKPGSDKTRPLGIPCIGDRLVQQCIKQVLEPICEAQFYPYSFGFRPDKGVEDAIHRAYRLANIHKLHYVVDVDIKGFFDNVDHNKLKKQMWSLKIRDKELLKIIGKMLKAPIQMPNGELIEPTKGTPQGGIISPLLANIVLNELDWWIASQWEEFPAKRVDYKAGEEYSRKSTMYKSLRENTDLKEMFIVRYADDFKIFTRTREEAEKILKAVEMWLMERLKLETSPEKSGITNIRKKCTDFLGIKFKVRVKGDKLVIVSHMTDKAKKKVKESLKEQVKKVQNPSNKINRAEEINRLNSMIMGFHEFYSLATEISQDLSEINKGYRITLYNRILKKLKHPELGELNPDSAIAKKYGNSKQLRFVEGQPIVPLAYCKTDPPMGQDKNFSHYTPEGREEIHKKLGVDLTELHRLMTAPVNNNHSIEFVNNRVSKYCAQYGKCLITEIDLSAEWIHCHHIIPKAMGLNDSYDNLIIVHPDVHRLIHAREVDTIIKYLPIIKDLDQLALLNKYRSLAGNFEISNMYARGIQLSFFDQV